MADIPDGWIAHDGGPCPVPLDSYPQVMARDGTIIRRRVAAGIWARGSADWWQHQGPERNNHIIAYKPEPSS